MIQINLLPKELRKSEPTPWPKLLALLVSLIVVLSVFFLMFYYKFNVLPGVLDERNRYEDEKKRLEEQAKKADDLEKEIKEFELREKTIVEIRQTRWVWAKVLDQLVDIIPSYIQITSLSVKEGRSSTRGKEEEGPTIEMDCYSESADEKNISKFRKRFMSSPLWAEVLDMPEWPYTLEDMNEQQVLKFKAILILRPKQVKKPEPAKKPAPRPPRPS